MSQTWINLEGGNRPWDIICETNNTCVPITLTYYAWHEPSECAPFTPINVAHCNFDIPWHFGQCHISWPTPILNPQYHQNYDYEMKAFYTMTCCGLQNMISLLDWCCTKISTFFLTVVYIWILIVCLHIYITVLIYSPTSIMSPLFMERLDIVSQNFKYKWDQSRFDCFFEDMFVRI